MAPSGCWDITYSCASGAEPISANLSVPILPSGQRVDVDTDAGTSTEACLPNTIPGTAVAAASDRGGWMVIQPLTVNQRN